jgi:hypothetical protein
VCRAFLVLCPNLHVFTEAIVAIEGSKFKVVYKRDKNVTERKRAAWQKQLDDSVARYLVGVVSETENKAR